MLHIMKKRSEPHHSEGALSYFWGQCTQGLSRRDSA